MAMKHKQRCPSWDAVTKRQGFEWLNPTCEPCGVAARCVGTQEQHWSRVSLEGLETGKKGVPEIRSRLATIAEVVSGQYLEAEQFGRKMTVSKHIHSSTACLLFTILHDSSRPLFTASLYGHSSFLDFEA